MRRRRRSSDGSAALAIRAPRRGRRAASGSDAASHALRHIAVPPTATVLASWAATIIRALEAQGLDGRRLAADAGVDLALLDDPEARVPSAAVLTLLHSAVAATADPAFGLTAAKFVQQTTFYALGYAMLASRTLIEALERMIRYRRLIGDLLEMRIESSADRYRLFVALSAPLTYVDAAVDTAVGTIVRGARLLRSDRLFDPVTVRLRRAEPADPEPYRRFFRAPIRFGEPADVLEFRRAELEAPLPAGNHRLAEQNDEIIVRYLALLDQDLASRVRREVLAALPSGTPTKHDIARRLAMSARNLQRHLGAEGTSFKALLQAARMTLADAYLREGRLSVKAIAFLLGFADAGAFSRAFKRWTGRAPSEARVGSNAGRGVVGAVPAGFDRYPES